MKEHITADNMCKLATKENDELNDILIKIEFAAKSGLRQIYIEGYIVDTTSIELIGRKFKVESGGRYNEVDTVISW